MKSRVEDDGLFIVADPGQLQQVLTNLVRNAAEALDGRSDGEILLTAAKEDSDRVVIKVTDNGPGIPERRLFRQKRRLEPLHRQPWIEKTLRDARRRVPPSP